MPLTTNLPRKVSELQALSVDVFAQDTNKNMNVKIRANQTFSGFLKCIGGILLMKLSFKGLPWLIHLDDTKAISGKINSRLILGPPECRCFYILSQGTKKS